MGTAQISKTTMNVTVKQATVGEIVILILMNAFPNLVWMEGSAQMISMGTYVHVPRISLEIPVNTVKYKIKNNANLNYVP